MKEFDSWINEVILSTDVFLSQLRKNSDQYMFYPNLKSTTSHGRKLNLGFSCYALKINYIIGNTDNFTESDINKWSDYINSFQTKDTNFPEGSYVDTFYLNYFQKLNFVQNYKWQIKDLLYFIKLYKGETSNDFIFKSIIAETKQAISTLLQVNSAQKFQYINNQLEESSLERLLNELNWENPWDAGAQFANTAFFLQASSKENYKEKEILINYIKKLVSQNTGTYGVERQALSSALVNGSMKVLTGLDWLDSEIHNPEKLIDSSLSLKPSSEGCDLVDVVYVLYKCSLVTEHRKTEIREYLKLILGVIQKHYFDQGGFSYFKDSCQTHYYGVKIANKFKCPDLHGTILLIWAISMIDSFLKDGNSKFNILKP